MVMFDLDMPPAFYAWLRAMGSDGPKLGKFTQWHMGMIESWVAHENARTDLPRYRLIGFVHEPSGHIMRQDRDGYTSLAKIFVSRPSEYRWCVAETQDRDFMLIDLYELMHSSDDDPSFDFVVDPHHSWRFAHEDAALASAVMRSRR